MNAKALIPLIAGLGIAGLAAKLGLDFVKKAEGKQAQVVKLWTPVQDIRRGMAIDESMLRPLAFPANVVPPGALADVKKIVGRVPHTGAPAGVPILNSMLLPPGVNAGVRVPPGLRAVAVKVDESSGVDNHLEPGCHVDVVGVFTVRKSNRTQTIARVIIENVEVAAVGQRLAPSTPTPDDEKSSQSARRERPARAVTLLVKPEQVPTLHLAEQKGKIKLSMRGVADEGPSGRSVKVFEDDLLGEAKPESEAPAAPSWRDRFDDFVSSLWNKPEPEPAPRPPAEPEPPAVEEPKLAWVMAVYNGDERQVLGWMNLDDFQAIELSSEGPNIFQEEPEFPPRKPGAGCSGPRPARPPGAQSGQKPQVRHNGSTQADSQTRPREGAGRYSEAEAEPETETETEPKELFE